MLRFLTAICISLLAIGAYAADVETVDLGGGVSMDFVPIPSGRVLMGSLPAEIGHGPDEEQHEAIIPDSFYLAKFPVTRGQFARFVQETAYRTEAEIGNSGGFGFDGTKLVQRKEFNWRNPGFTQTDTHPVVIVTYDDALAFARWLSKKTNRACTLPTEAQWEYACRAGTINRFYNGNADSDAEKIAWFKKNSGNSTHPVGEKEPNNFGLYDMSGNVYEWCLDFYAPYVTGGGVQGPMDKPRRVLRGGSWMKDINHVRSAARARNAAGSRNADNGFRIVMSAAKLPPAVAVAPTPPPPPVNNFAVEDDRPIRSNPPPISAPISAPTPTIVTHSNGGGMFTFVIIAIVLITAFIIAMIIFAILKSFSGPKPAPRSLSNVQPRLVDDGFWFDTSGYNPGEVVTYSYRGPSGMIAREFIVEPSDRGQFIYTGVRPMDLTMGSLIAAKMARKAQQQPPPRPAPSRTRDDDDDTFRRYPSAY